jgi:hypothetical protein
MSLYDELTIETRSAKAYLRWHTRTQDVVATFMVGDVNVRVTFEQEAEARRHRQTWRVLFESDRPVADEQLTESLDILSGVFEAAEEFIQIWEPDILTFVSRHPERASIYGKFLKKKEPQLKVLGYEALSSKVGCYMEFCVRRTGASRWIPL